MNQTEKRLLTSDALLYTVLETCRAKSNLDVAEWHKLKKSIEEHLSGANIAYRPTTVKKVRNVIVEKQEVTAMRARMDILSRQVKAYQDILNKIRKLSSRNINNYIRENEDVIQ